MASLELSNVPLPLAHRRRADAARRGAHARLAAALACCVALLGVAPRATFGQPAAANQPAGAARATPSAPDPALGIFIDRLKEIAQRADREGYLALLDESAERRAAVTFAGTEFRTAGLRAAVQEVDRAVMDTTDGADGVRLTVDVFVEFSAKGRVATWQLDLVRRQDGWRIAGQNRLSRIDNLYRLAVNRTQQYDASNFTVRGEDFSLTLERGSVFTVDTDQGVTGLVLLGRGVMRFSPAPETERGQARIFSGAETVDSLFDAAYLRLGAADVQADMSALTARAVDARDLRRAEQVFREESPKTFAVDLSALSSNAWWLLPGKTDLVAEIRTSRFGTLTYTRSFGEAEDVSFFDRKRRKNISVYASKEKLARRGPFYSEDDQTAYDVLDYDIDVAVAPGRELLEGRARLTLVIRANSASQLTLRLASSLDVKSIVSDEYGRLFHVRLKEQNALLVGLPATLLKDTPLTVTITYGGRLPAQAVEREALALGQAPTGFPRPGSTMPRMDIVPEALAPRLQPSFLYSGRTYWYPQPMNPDFATATLRLTIPATFDGVASGQRHADSPVVFAGPTGLPNDQLKRYTFQARRPIRYLAFLISRFSLATRMSVVFDPEDAPTDAEGPRLPATGPGAPFGTLDLSVEANPEQVHGGRENGDQAADIVRFYRSLLGDSPYPSFTLALVGDRLPGGHSPGYFALLKQPMPYVPSIWINDPAAFDGFPEFFLAHEIAHQWWGQAVGGQNYHEQWLSEGFAQYFAALYAERRHGDQLFGSVLRHMRRWALDSSDEGPIYLGYRVGHLRGDSRVFRAIVYNKSALVLHMLRQLVGDDAFFRGVRRFYTESRFRKAGTDALRLAMEAESGRSLQRFFEQWIYGSKIPKLAVTSRVEPAGSSGATPTLAVRITQLGEVFDIPITFLVQYQGKKPVPVVVKVTDRDTEARIPLEGPAKNVELNRTTGVLAEFVKAR